MDKKRGETRNKKIVVKSFKGMETVVDASGLPLSLADNAENVSFDIDGGIRKREGIERYQNWSELSNIDSYELKRLQAEISNIEGLNGGFVTSRTLTQSDLQRTAPSAKFINSTPDPDVFRISSGILYKNNIEILNIGAMLEPHETIDDFIAYKSDYYVIIKKEINPLAITYYLLKNPTIQNFRGSIIREYRGYRKFYINKQGRLVYAEVGYYNNRLTIFDAESETQLVNGQISNDIYRSSPLGFDKMGSFYFFGFNHLATRTHILIAKLNEDGTAETVLDYNFEELDVSGSIGFYPSIDGDGNVYIIGELESSSTTYWFNKNGRMVWQKLEYPTDDSNIRDVTISKFFIDTENNVLNTLSVNGRTDRVNIMKNMSPVTFSGFLIGLFLLLTTKQFNIYSIDNKNNIYLGFQRSTETDSRCAVLALDEHDNTLHIKVDSNNGLIAYGASDIFTSNSEYGARTSIWERGLTAYSIGQQESIKEITISTKVEQSRKNFESGKHIYLLDADWNIKKTINIPPNQNTFSKAFTQQEEKSIGKVMYIGYDFDPNFREYTQSIKTQVETTTEKGQNKLKKIIEGFSVTLEEENENIIMVSNYETDSNGNKTNQKLHFYLNDKSGELGIFNKGKLNNGGISISDSNIIDTAILSNNIIISTPKNIYGARLIKNYETDSTGSKVPSYYIWFGEAKELAYQESYEEAVGLGINFMKENPLKYVAQESDLVTDSVDIIDILITEFETVPSANIDKYSSYVDNNLAVGIEANTKYQIVPQIERTALSTSAGRKDQLSYAWKLFARGADVSSSTATNPLKWVEIPNKINNSDKEFPTIGPLDHDGQYQLSLTLDGTDSNGKAVSLSKKINFSVKNKTFEEIKNSQRTLYNEIISCKYVDVFDGKAVYYGNGTEQIYTSNIDNPFYVTTNNIVKADQFNKAEPIVKIANFKDTKIIFTNSTMMSMTGSGNFVAGDPWKIFPLDGAVGAVGHEAVTNIENTLGFVDRNGIYIITQLSVAEKRVQLQQISSAINDLALPYKDVVDKTNEKLMSNIVVENLERRMFISYPDNDFTLVYDYINGNIAEGKWSKWTGIVPTHYLVKDNELLMFNKGDKQNIYKKFPRVSSEVHEIEKYPGNFFEDNGTAYPFVYKTKATDFGESYTFKKIKRITVETDNTGDGYVNFNIIADADYQPSVVFNVNKQIYANPKIGSFILGSSMANYRPSYNINRKAFTKSKSGRVNSFKIEQRTAQPFSLKSIMIEYSASRMKGRKIK